MQVNCSDYLIIVYEEELERLFTRMLDDLYTSVFGSSKLFGKFKIMSTNDVRVEPNDIELIRKYAEKAKPRGEFAILVKYETASTPELIVSNMSDETITKLFMYAASRFAENANKREIIELAVDMLNI